MSYFILIIVLSVFMLFFIGFKVVLKRKLNDIDGLCGKFTRDFNESSGVVISIDKTPRRGYKGKP